MHSEDIRVVRKYTVKEAREKFKDLVDGVTYTREPAIVTKHGNEKVAVIPYDLLELLIRLEALVDMNKADSALDEYERNGGVTLEELKKELNIK